MTDQAQDPEPVAADSSPPPDTGDLAVDEALTRLHRSAQGGDLDAQADAGEAADQALRARLADLGGD